MSISDKNIVDKYERSIKEELVFYIETDGILGRESILKDILTYMRSAGLNIKEILKQIAYTFSGKSGGDAPSY
jgi:hypothetical protein